MVQLTEKQRFVLQDLRQQEKMCVEKYEKGEQMAKDPVLKELFASIKKEEQEHYDSLGQVLEGTVPQVEICCGGEKNYNPTATYTGNYIQLDKDNDQFLCTDSITTEKYVSSAYNFELFQFAEPDLRRLFQDIELEEQNHAAKIYKYKTVNQMT